MFTSRSTWHTTLGLLLLTGMSFGTSFWWLHGLKASAQTPSRGLTPEQVTQVEQAMQGVDPGLYRITLPVFQQGKVVGSRTYGSLPLAQVRQVAAAQRIPFSEKGNVQLVLKTVADEGGGGGGGGNDGTGGGHGNGGSGGSGGGGGSGGSGGGGGSGSGGSGGGNDGKGGGHGNGGGGGGTNQPANGRKLSETLDRVMVGIDQRQFTLLKASAPTTKATIGSKATMTQKALKQ